MYPKIFEHLIEQLVKLPGIGRRSAERIAFWLLSHPREETQAIAHSIFKLKDGLMFCHRCSNLSETEICSICSDPSREKDVVCVVETSKDLLAIERSGSFQGIYHVLLGTISPADGRGPEDLRIRQLMKRISLENIKEVIIATDPDNEGEMTALYLADQLKAYSVKVSRIGFGIPVGSSVEYTDLSTLSMSLTSRRTIEN